MLLIYLSNATTRTKYIFDLIFNQEFGLLYGTTSDAGAFNAYQQEKINYSSVQFSNSFFIKASSLLSENFIKKSDVVIGEKFESKVLFPNQAECDLGFDIFSAIFYIITRYEEYLPFIADEHGRFKAEDSLAYRNNFLQTPVVNVWISHFKIALQNKFPTLQIKSSVYKTIVTYDIDVAYKFKGRSFLRNTGSIANDVLQFNFKNIRSRISTFLNRQKDPWDAYDYIEKTVTQNNLASIFFFLLGDFSKNDRNLDYKNPLLQSLINKIKTFSEIGIHPSYNSSSNTTKIISERKRLEEISGKTIYKSRQHFLKFTLPDTYNALLSAAITEDYSMGFSDSPGFRAGTCKPFYFYDLKNEKITNLKIFPVTVMEGSFMKNNRSPELALQDIFNLIEEVKKVHGTFISIWHNHTVSETPEFKVWKIVHDKIIQKIISENNS